MAEMRIAMTLSLADLASGPLGKFMAQIEELQAQADGVTASFNKMGTSGVRAGAQAADGVTEATGAVGGLNDSLKTVATTAEASGTAAGTSFSGAAEKISIASRTMLERFSRALFVVRNISAVAAENVGMSFTEAAKEAGLAGSSIARNWARSMDAAVASTRVATEEINLELDSWGRTAAQEETRFQAVMTDMRARTAAANTYVSQTLNSGGGAVPVGASTSYAAVESGAAEQQIADLGTLDAIMAKTAVSTAELGTQEQALDRLMAAGMVSTTEYGAALDMLNVQEEAIRLQVDKTTAALVKQRVVMGGGSKGGGFRFRGLYGTISQGLNAIMSPIGAVVGAIAAMGIDAAVQGGRIERLRGALVATGDAAGVTTSQVDGWAASIGNSISTVGDAQAAYRQLAMSGVFIGQKLKEAGDAAVTFAALAGEKSTQAASAIERMATDPVSALKYLTGAEHDQVQQLIDVGDKAEAGSVAVAAFARQMHAAAAQINADIPIWDRYGDAVANALENYGRTLNTAAGGGTLQSKITYLKGMVSGQATPGERAAMQAHYGPQIAALEAQLHAQEAAAKQNAVSRDWIHTSAGWGAAGYVADERTIRHTEARLNMSYKQRIVYEKAYWTHIHAIAKKGSAEYNAAYRNLTQAGHRLMHTSHGRLDLTANVGAHTRAMIAAEDRQIKARQHALSGPERALAAGEHTSPAAIRAKYAKYAATFQSFGMPSMASRATALGEHLANKAGYKTSTGELSKLHAQLRAEEEVNAARVQVGSITKSQGEQKDLALQRQIAPAMEKAAEAAKQFAKALNDKTLIASMDAMLLKIQAMGHALNETQKSIQRTFQSATQSFLQQLMLGRTTWRNMFANLNNSIMTGINQAIAKHISQALVGSASNSGAGSGFLSLFSSGTGGSGSSGGSSMWGGIVSAIGDYFTGNFFPSFAVGTDYVPHDMLANIHQGEAVVPAADMVAMRKGVGHTINQSVNITAMDSNSMLTHLSGIRRELAIMVGDAASGLNLQGG